jgi:hypothetical protein
MEHLLITSDGTALFRGRTIEYWEAYELFSERMGALPVIVIDLVTGEDRTEEFLSAVDARMLSLIKQARKINMIEEFDRVDDAA